MGTRTKVRALAIAAAAVYLVWYGTETRATKPPGAATNALVAARPYRIKAPGTIDPRRNYPLVLVLHGLGGRGENVERYYQLDPLVDELGFLAVYPDGTEETRARHFWSSPRRFWNATDACCDFFGSGVDDVAYLDAVIDDVNARYHVDPKRVFVMGLSNGGYMSYRFACDRASRVAAIASQAGAMWLDATRCRPSEPVAVLELHGTNDERVPYEGLSQRGPYSIPIPSAHQSVADWVALDKCDAKPDTSSPPLDLLENGAGSSVPDTETVIEKWNGCRGVELWTMRGAPHVPHPNQPLWARTIYTWLAAHPKP
jgi:polyhydroxybutyrate depolymerase